MGFDCWTGFCSVSSSFPGLVRSSGFTWHDMNHTAAFGWIGLSFFWASSLYLAMMRILRDVAARVVFRMNCLLQFFTPEELHRLEVRWDTTVFKLVSLRERFWDQSFKAGLSSVWVFWLYLQPCFRWPWLLFFLSRSTLLRVLVFFNCLPPLCLGVFGNVLWFVFAAGFFLWPPTKVDKWNISFYPSENISRV